RDGAEEALRLEQFRQVLRLPAECAVDKDRRIQVGFGNADQGTLRGYLPFRTADIRSATQQVCRDTGGHPDRTDRQPVGIELRPWSQLGRQIARRDAE